MQLLASLGARERCRTLVVQDGAIWIWPGILMTLQCGGEIEAASNEICRFWITRLHGPDALYKDLFPAMSRAVSLLTQGNEAKAQGALDALGLFALSRDGAALMKAVARDLDIEVLSMPVDDGPRTWNTQDISQHLAFFKEGTEASRLLAKGTIPVFDPAKHPRWPAGAPQSQGGQFAPADGSGASVVPIASRGIGDNGGPPLDDPPEIPKEEPPPPKRTITIRAIARALARAIEADAHDAVADIARRIETTVWLMRESNKALAEIRSYQDPPYTLGELFNGPVDRTGYQLHHIVEQTPAEQDGFPRSQIDGDENLIYVPTLKHRDISAWYQKGNDRFDGLSPRDYLRGKTWEVRRDVGIQALIDAKVLKR